MTTEVTAEEQIAKSIIPEVVLAYIAGIVDGEGSISIKRQQQKSFNPTFTLSVTICSTTVSVINFVQSCLGGNIYSHENHTVNRKTMYVISWHSSRAQEILKLILPYLIIKKEIAELGVAFQDVVLLKGRELGRATPCSKWELELREIMHAKSREYNS